MGCDAVNHGTSNDDSIRTACKRRSGFSVFNTEANRHR
jgi:hypothetical protein